MNLFGSSGGYSDWFKKENRGGYAKYAAEADQAFGPQALQQMVGGYNDDMSRILENQGAGGYGSLVSRGFAPGSPDLYGLTRATNLSKFRAGAKMDLKNRYLEALRAKFGMLQGMAQSEYKAPSSGVLGGIAGMAGQAAGLGWQPFG